MINTRKLLRLVASVALFAIVGSLAIAPQANAKLFAENGLFVDGFPPTTAGLAYQRPYISGNTYLHGPLPVATTSTNTQVIASNLAYAIPGYAAAPFVMTAIAVRTSSSNASSGASVKACIYAVGADGKPSTLLGTSSAGQAIGNSAVSTTYSLTLDAPVSIPAGPFYIATLGTATTTQARYTIYAAASGFSANGATTAANALGTSPTVGYTASQTYASGCANPFGTATEVTVVTNAPAVAYTVQ
jgi:hypothetical protein